MHIHVLNLLAQIRLLFDQPDKAIFHLQKDLRALLDILCKCASRLDDEFLASELTNASLAISLS